MSDSVKLQHIHANARVHRTWISGGLTHEQRRYVLDGTDIAIDEAWLLSLIEDAKEIEQ